MKASKLLLATLKETPTDASIVSHQLMLRAGMIRKLGSGLYTWLPLGYRVLKKVENIIREEMDKAGAQELLMPSIQPAELWEESGRWDQFGPSLLKFQDRHNNTFCYGPTHEEVITTLARFELKSYRQLPMTLYQIQTKFRDEVRPRFGVMRAREFLMKDAYSFHTDLDSLEETYQLMFDTYTRIFTRLGLTFRPVLADSGSMGGNKTHEFQVLADSGEDAIAYCEQSDYAANIETAAALEPAPAEPSKEPLTLVDTPNQKTIGAVANFLSLKPEATIKTLIVHGDAEHPLVALILRGDHTLNELKAEKHPWVKAPLSMASDTEIKAALNCSVGSIGPVNLKIPTIVDRSAAVLSEFVCGANSDDRHYMHAVWHRDADLTEVTDLRNVVEGDLSPDGEGTLKIRRGIEVGQVFQLGNKYTKAMNATVLDKDGKATIMEMGCYGIGVSRTVAAAIEQHYDEKGIVWPEAMAPFDIVLVPLFMHKSEKVKMATEKLYKELTESGHDVLLDDRDERPGVKFADMELIGIPHRIVISERGLDKNEMEYKYRSATDCEYVMVDQVLDFLKNRCNHVYNRK